VKKIVKVGDPLLTPYEVAVAFGVNSKTVSRWRKAGKFPEGAIVRTLGGHYRFKVPYIEAMLNGREYDPDAPS
jgi:predicted site-specific integrase-resolvase